MNYTTFIGTTTLSLATVFATGGELEKNNQQIFSIDKAYTIVLDQNATYTPTDMLQTSTDFDKLVMLAEFANDLFKNNKPLDNDIAKLIDDNIMELLT